MRKTRGIVMVSVLFLLVIVVMLATAVSTRAIMQQHYTLHFYQSVTAVKAAEAGIQYALARLTAIPDWRGYSPLETDTPLLVSSMCGLTVYEHRLPGGGGCVEGKIDYGTSSGYFDLYFESPGSLSMIYFTESSEAGPRPENFLLSSNNRLTGGILGGSIDASDFFGSVTTRRVPANAVLLVSRGKVGQVEKFVESCISFGVDLENYNSVISGRGNINLIHCGRDEGRDMIVFNSSSDKPSVLCSSSDIKVSMDSGSGTYYPRNDYMMMLAKGSGGISLSNSPDLNPVPKIGRDGFEKKDDKSLEEQFLRPLKIDAVTPKDDVITNFLSPGTYHVLPRDSKDPEYGKSPIVYYYKTDNPSSIVDPTRNYAKDMTNDFSLLIGKGKMSWDPGTRRLVLNESFQVAQDSLSGSTLSSLNFVNSLKSRFTLQIGPDPREGEEFPPVYLVNAVKNGNISVEGQLSGVGTIICDGNLTMEAESQLAANDLNGLSIYAGKDVTIKEIALDPYIAEGVEGFKWQEYNVKLSIFDKINQFALEKKDDAYYADISKIVDGQPSNMTPENQAYFQKMQDLKIKDDYRIPRDYFTSEEQSMIVSQLGGGSAFYYDSIAGREFLMVDMSPRGSFSSHPIARAVEDSNNATFDGVKRGFDSFRMWHLEDTFYAPPEVDENEMSSPGMSPEGKRDFKGRLINAKDSIFRGFIYSCGNFSINSPNRSFVLDGGLTAFGGNTDGTKGTGGNVTIQAADAMLNYNTKYLGLLNFSEVKESGVKYWSSGNLKDLKLK